MHHQQLCLCYYIDGSVADAEGQGHTGVLLIQMDHHHPHNLILILVMRVMRHLKGSIHVLKISVTFISGHHRLFIGGWERFGLAGEKNRQQQDARADPADS